MRTKRNHRPTQQAISKQSQDEYQRLMNNKIVIK